MPFAATWLELEITMLSEESQRKTNIGCHLYKNLQKIIQIYLFTKQKQTQLRQWTYGYQEGRMEGGIVREFGIDIYTLLYFKLITNKDLCISEGMLLNILS